MKRRLISSALAMLILFSIAGCSNNDSSNGSDPTIPPGTSAGNGNNSTTATAPQETENQAEQTSPPAEQQKYINPGKEVAGNNLAKMLTYTKGSSKRRCMITLTLDDVDLSTLQPDGENTLKNSTTAITSESLGSLGSAYYSYNGITVKTPKLNFSIANMSQISDANIESEFLYGKEIKKDDNFRLKYEKYGHESSEIQYIIMVLAYHFQNEEPPYGKHYAEIRLNGVTEESEAAAIYNILRNSLHFYFETDSDSGTFEGTAGAAPNFADYVFFEDILLAQES